MQQQHQSEFIELRQQLKESIRNKKKMQNGNALASPPISEPKKTKLTYNEFGSFFGPSQPAIASSVLKESKSLATKILKSIEIEANKANEVTESKKRKADKLKDSRDYSFLFSDDDAKLPSPPNESHSKPVSSRSLRTGSSTQRPNPRQERVVEKIKVSQELASVRVDHRRKLPSSNLRQERVVELRKVSQELIKSSQTVPRESLQRAQQLKKKNKKVVKKSKDDDDALRIVRKMCRTDCYAERDFDDDDECMEATFEDILKEERRSEKLAKKEDAEQQRLIEEEEERLERMRKEKKKKQKLSN